MTEKQKTIAAMFLYCKSLHLINNVIVHTWRLKFVFLHLIVIIKYTSVYKSAILLLGSVSSTITFSKTWISRSSVKLQKWTFYWGILYQWGWFKNLLTNMNLKCGINTGGLISVVSSGCFNVKQKMVNTFFLTSFFCKSKKKANSNISFKF